jgi:hypothetical protein
MRKFCYIFAFLFIFSIFQNSGGQTANRLRLIGKKIRLAHAQIPVFDLSVTYDQGSKRFFFVWAEAFNENGRNYQKLKGRFLSLDGKLSPAKTYSFPEFRVGNSHWPRLAYNSSTKKLVLWWEELFSPNPSVKDAYYSEVIDSAGRILEISSTKLCCTPLIPPTAYQQQSDRFLIGGFGSNLLLFDGTGKLLSDIQLQRRPREPYFLFADDNYFYLISGLPESTMYLRISTKGDIRETKFIRSDSNFLLSTATLNPKSNEFILVYDDKNISPNTFTKLFSRRVNISGQALAPLRFVTRNFYFGDGMGLANFAQNTVLAYHGKEEVRVRLLGRYGGPTPNDLRISSASQSRVWNLDIIAAKNDNRHVVYWTDTLDYESGIRNLYAQLLTVQ